MNDEVCVQCRKRRCECRSVHLRSELAAAVARASAAEERVAALEAERDAALLRADESGGNFLMTSVSLGAAEGRAEAAEGLLAQARTILADYDVEVRTMRGIIAAVPTPTNSAGVALVALADLLGAGGETRDGD